MAQANLSVRIDENDKKSFEVFCNETGMNVSVAINMFIKTVLREHKLPFEIKADPFYSKSNMSYLENIVKDINDGVAKLEEHDLIEPDNLVDLNELFSCFSSDEEETEVSDDDESRSDSRASEA